jgi:hypothetical protein
MALVVRITDVNTAGGMAMAPRLTVLAEFLPLAAYMSPVSPHPCCGAPGCEIHCVATIAPMYRTVLADYLPVHIVTDPDICGHIRITGATTVLCLDVGGSVPGSAPIPNTPVGLGSSSGYGEVGLAVAP